MLDRLLAFPREVLGGGQLRAFAVASKQRLPALPDVPTLAEVGTPVNMGAWLAVMAPRGLPDDLVQQLGKELQKVAPLADWMSHYALFWQDRFANLRTLLKEIDP